MSTVHRAYHPHSKAASQDSGYRRLLPFRLHNLYTSIIELTNPQKGIKKYENIPAEDVIAHGGKHNKVALIENPELFCNATYFYAESLFGEVFNSLDEGEIENWRRIANSQLIQKPPGQDAREAFFLNLLSLFTKLLASRTFCYSILFTN